MATEGTRSGSTSIGAAIAGYRVARLLGGGRFGRVFECYTPDDQKIAIKLLRTKFNALGDPLLKNVRTLQQVQSPHVVTVLDVAVYSGSTYVAMEHVDGEDLKTRLILGPLRSADALSLARQAALGLQALWAHGVAHGDVRPANLLIADQTLKVVDALLTPLVEGTETVRGTAEYLAPERLVGTPPDALSDIYALGCTLHEMLSGQPPFEGTVSELFEAHGRQQPPPLATSPSVADLVTKMMAKDRAQRVKTWSEVIEGIDRALAGSAQTGPVRGEVPALDVVIEDFGDLDVDDPFGDVPTSEIPAFAKDSTAAIKDGVADPGRSSTPAGPAIPTLESTPPAPAARPASQPPRPAPPPPAVARPAGPNPTPQPPRPTPLPPGVIPVIPLVRPGDDDEGRTVVRPMTSGAGRPIPSADDIGLTLDPIDD
jgi:eukaryotic-like serine/threonine-protein kinase